ncbi:MAG: regulator [Oscillatoriales cyanobacterium CG2_30_44_21]|nr:MAG: regulator [Oscillatoriales cyanobacterium CG2_30_44_21]
MSIALAPYAESTLTDRYQTTVPEPVRKALGLTKRDKICYTIQPDGRVLIARIEQNDPLIDKFLNFLAQDIAENPQNIEAISSSLLTQVRSLVAEVEIDLDATLADEDE